MASNNRRELTIVLTGDAKGLTGTVKVIEAEMKKLGGSFDVVGDKARGAGKDAEDAAKRIESSNKRTAAAIGLVVAGAVAGFSALVKHQLDVADATGKMAQRLGVSTEFLSSMGYAAKSTGADSQVLASSLQSLAENQLKAAGGNKQYTAAFKAMGISFRDARGQLVPLADLLPAIAERFRTMPDGANKAALAAKLFGTEGTKLIPMLNQGAQGLADMAEQAAGLGLVLSQEAVDGATALKDQIDLLKSKMEGAANVFLREMLPSVLAMSGDMGDAADKTNDFAEVAVVLADALKGVMLVVGAVANGVQALAQLVAAAVTGMGEAIDGLRQTYTKMGETHDKVQSLILHGRIGDAFTAWKQGLNDIGDTSTTAFGKVTANAATAMDALKSQALDVQKLYHQLFPTDAEKGQAALAADTAALRREMDRNHEILMAGKTGDDWAGHGNAAAERQRNIDGIAADYTKLAAIQDKLTGGTDALNKAWSDSATQIRAIAALGADMIKRGVDESTVQAQVAKMVDVATAARNRAIEAARRQMDVSGRMIEQMQREAQLASMSPRDQAMARAGWEYEQEARQKNLDLTKDQIAAERQRVEEAAGASFDMQRYAEMQKQIAQEYVGFWENAAGSTAKLFADGLTGQVHDLKDFARSGKSILQQWVSDIIAQFLRLRVLGPLLGGAMGAVAGWLGIGGTGGAGSWLQMASQYYGGGSTIGSAAGALGGGGGGGSGGSYGGMISNINTARNAYNWAFGSGGTGAPFGGSIVGGSYITGPGLGTGAAGTAGSAGYAVNMPNGAVMYTGNGTMVSPATPYGGYIGNTGLSYAGVAGGLAGAYWGSQRGSGGVSTAASTVTGAVGGYYAGAAVATAMSSGVAAGLAAIPVVGWIALAAMLVDQISGGKLFGTKYKTAAINSSMSIGEGGADASLSLYQTKQRALFGGRKTRAVDQAVPPELQQAADSLYEGVRQTMVQGAQKLAIDVPAMINASLKTHVALNDKGQVRSTDYVVEYLGRTWKEATAEAASKRIGAEALVATVAASAGAVAQQIAEQWRSSADTLLDGATAMLAAQADINKGNSLVALGAGATLAQVIKFTQGLQAQGEALADTYARLAQASAQYTQFVKQFEPTSAGFGSSLQAIANQMQANIDQANALAQAAGLQHAREADLANIHRAAAEQAAAAIAQLSAAAQDLVTKLYDATGNSLAAVTALLDKLHDKTQSALQLALGDKSPMTDNEKLQLALQGLRSGLTSADDVLSIGRNLYASGADYNALYAQVQGIAGLPGGTGQPSLQDALSQYSALAAKQQDLQAQANAAARTADARTLAQYVADISSTHGIGYGDVASGLGFSLQDLAKDLGVTDVAKYLDQLKLADVPGTVLDASSSIVSAIQQLGRDLIQSITGAPITTATVKPPAVAPNDPQVIALLQSIDAQLQQQGKTLDHKLGAIVQHGSDTLQQQKSNSLRETLNR